jgi:hypothetical protein
LITRLFEAGNFRWGLEFRTLEGRALGTYLEIPHVISFIADFAFVPGTDWNPWHHEFFSQNIGASSSLDPNRQFPER